MARLKAEPIEGLLADIRQLIIAGFTGRHEHDVQAHIDELVAEGIAAPKRVPAFYDVSVERVTMADIIMVSSPESSGEVEPILVFGNDNVWLGIGSDHTARDLERVDIASSKAACPKVIGTQVWSYDAVQDDFGELRLRSWVRINGSWSSYQDDVAAVLMDPADILASYQAEHGSMTPPTVVFLGTVPLLTDGFRYGDAFRAVIDHPSPGTRLEIQYEVDCIVQPGIV